MDHTPEKKGSRNIEMIVGSKKQVAQTAQNWNPKGQHDENEVKMITPTKPTSAEKKLVPDRDILKERSPQPQRYSINKEHVSSGKKHSSPILTSADRRQSQIQQEEVKESFEVFNNGKISPAEPDQYDEVYQMYKEMASLIRDGMPASDSENGSNKHPSEENKKS